MKFNFMIVHCPIFFPFIPHVNEQKQKNISISVQYLAISCHLTLYNNTFQFLTISNNILHFLTDRNTYKCYIIVKFCDYNYGNGNIPMMLSILLSEP